MSQTLVEIQLLSVTYSNAQRRSLSLRKLNDFSNISSVGWGEIKRSKSYNMLLSGNF